MAALNVGGHAGMSSVSCVSAGNCAAGGSYDDGSGTQAFVVSEQGGVWGRAIEVPDTAALNSGGAAGVASVSCAGVGECAAGGFYSEPSSPVDHQNAFVVSEKNGKWGRAIEVAALLNVGGIAAVSSVSCGSPGNCAAAGYVFGSIDKYGDPIHVQAFVVSETNGWWRTARLVPTAAALNGPGDSSPDSVSCVGVGHCLAGGQAPNGKAFLVATTTNGQWGHGRTVPGLAALTGGVGNSTVRSVSCTSRGNCAVGGVYADPANRGHAFVASERNGVWQNAVEVPGLAALNLGHEAVVDSISCAAAGSCAAGGFYTEPAPTHALRPFVVAEQNGVWGTAVQVPGTATLNVGGYAFVTSVSCASAVNCSAVGYYYSALGGLPYPHPIAPRAFVVSEQNGTWGTAHAVPGLAALDLGGDSFASSISCARGGRCAVGGRYYSDSSDISDDAGHHQPFVTP